MKREEELMTNLQDVQEEVDEKGKLVNKLKKRYKAALNEIKDLDEEHQIEKSDLLDTIRTIERDLDFYKSVVDIILKQDQLYRIKAKSRYDNENNKWTVPPFVFKAAEVNFPKLNMNRMKELINNEKDNNIVEFTSDKESKINTHARQTGNFKSVQGKKFIRLRICLYLSYIIDYNSSGHNSYENTGDSENKHAESIQSPVRFESKARLSNGINEFMNTEYKAENRIAKDMSRESTGFNGKDASLKLKAQKQANLASKFDKNIMLSSNQNKLPPSIRWVSNDDDADPDFFGDGLDTNYQRNPKAIAQLAPLASNKGHGMHSLSTEPAEHRISYNELSLKKKGRLKPLRD